VLDITTIGSAQLNVSATNIRHRQVVHRNYRIDISNMCSAIWRVWGEVCKGRDVACVDGGCTVWGYYGTGVVIGSHALLYVCRLCLCLCEVSTHYTITAYSTHTYCV
jgi:hypothetical protein